MTPSPTPLERKIREIIQKCRPDRYDGMIELSPNEATLEILSIFQDEVKEFTTTLEKTQCLACYRGDHEDRDCQKQKTLTKWRKNSGE